MILADTSVWVDHLRVGNPALQAALVEGNVLVHPLVIGELACGNIARRPQVIALLRELPQALEASHAEALALIDRRRLMGRGMGYIDIQLLAAALITPLARLWTLDKRLAAAAKELEIAPFE